MEQFLSNVNAVSLNKQADAVEENAKLQAVLLDELKRQSDILE
jgi:hypothetical protein